MFQANWSHLRGSFLGSQNGAGSRARPLLCSASVCLRVSVPTGGGGRRLSLDGCTPADGSLCWGLVPAISLLLPGERQSSEEGELRIDVRKLYCNILLLQVHTYFYIFVCFLYLFVSTWLALWVVAYIPIGWSEAAIFHFFSCSVGLLSDFSSCWGQTVWILQLVTSCLLVFLFLYQIMVRLLNGRTKWPKNDQLQTQNDNKGHKMMKTEIKQRHNMFKTDPKQPERTQNVQNQTQLHKTQNTQNCCYCHS